MVRGRVRGAGSIAPPTIRPGRGSTTRAFEAEPAVILVAVVIGFGQWGGAHQDRLRPLGAVVIAAEREEPGCAGLGTAPGHGEGRPRNPPFDGPAPIDIPRPV